MCTTNRFAIIHKALKEKNNTISVNQLCKTAHVSRSGYYRWRSAERKRAEKQKSDETDFRIILDAYKYKGYDKGVKGIHMRLLHSFYCIKIRSPFPFPVRTFISVIFSLREWKF